MATALLPDLFQRGTAFLLLGVYEAKKPLGFTNVIHSLMVNEETKKLWALYMFQTAPSLSH